MALSKENKFLNLVGLEKYHEKILVKIDEVAKQYAAGALHFEGAKDTFEEVEALTNMSIGDVWCVGDKEYAYDGTQWVELGFGIDISGKADKTYVDSTFATKTALAEEENKRGQLDTKVTEHIEEFKNFESKTYTDFVTHTNATIEGMGSEIANNKDAIESLGTRVGKNETAIASHDTRLDTAEDKISTAEGKITANEEAIADLEDTKVGKSDVIAEADIVALGW